MKGADVLLFALRMQNHMHAKSLNHKKPLRNPRIFVVLLPSFNERGLI
jgi:hypothetical protein